MSVAISQVFGSALQGRCKDRPELAATAIPISARIDVLDDLEYEEYAEQPRPTDEIVELIGELLEKVWHNRHLHFRQEVRAGRETCDPQVMAGAIRSATKVEEK